LIEDNVSLKAVKNRSASWKRLETWLMKKLLCVSFLKNGWEFLGAGLISSTTVLDEACMGSIYSFSPTSCSRKESLWIVNQASTQRLKCWNG
jgi:hypothetical protein